MTQPSRLRVIAAGTALLVTDCSDPRIVQERLQSRTLHLSLHLLRVLR